MKRTLILLMICILIGVLPFNVVFAEDCSDIYFGADYDFLEPFIRVMAVDELYLWAGGGDFSWQTNILYRSDDFGDNWEEVKKFDKIIESIHITYDNTIMVSLSDGRWLEEANSEILISKDGGISFESVLDLKSGAAYTWNIASDDEGYIFVSEYGYKSLPDNSRRIYRSKDGGLSWEIVYEPKEREGYHNHIIHIDKNDKNIIYQVIGDDNKAILRSSDRGDTWDKMISGTYHPTSVVQIDDDLFYGLDGAPKSGIIKYNTGTKKLKFTFETPKPFGGSVYDMMYVNDVIYAAFLSYSDPGNPWDASIYISRDKGNTWENFCIWPKHEGMGVGIYKFTHQGDYGYIWGTFPIDHENGTSYYGTLRFKLVK